MPFYAVLAIAGGRLNQLFGTPIAVWNPLQWSTTNLRGAWRDIAGSSAFIGPIILRTIWYTAAASVLCLIIGYPAAYFVARFGGRRKALFLVLLIAPFWISYMMRMLAWIDLLQTNGYVNKALMFLHLADHPINWLSGLSVTVILGLVYGYIPYLILVLYAGLDRIDPALIEAGRDLGLGRARTFLRVTLPLSRQPIMTAMLITVLPMLGDYFTNQLLSGTTNTSMLGNVIDQQLLDAAVPGRGRRALADGAARPGHPDDLVRGRDQPDVTGRGMTTTTTTPPPPPSSRPPPAPGPGRPARAWWPRRNPWGHPWFLEGFTWLYLIWSLVPIGLAVLFSFNNGKSQAVWQGFSWRWYFTDPVNSVLHDPALSTAVLVTLRLSFYTTLIAVPLGVAFALGINRWYGVTAASFNFVMILSFVIPELIFGVAMFFVFTSLFTFVHLGTLAETLALVTWNVSWPAIIVQARLVTIGKQYEEAAADLGANQWQTMRRVLHPAADPGHLRQRGAGLLQRHRRLRARGPAELGRQQHADVGVHLREPARRQRRARAQRPRHHHAGDVLRHRHPRLPGLPLADPWRTGQRAGRAHLDRGRRLTHRSRRGAQGAARPAPRVYQGCPVANMAQTTLPLGPGGVQPHSSHSDDTTCSPRPDSPNQHCSLGTGTSSLGSETAHSTHGPGCSRPSRTGQRGQTAPGQGTVYRSALVSSSDTTTTMSSHRSSRRPSAAASRR